jgi:hypothetical protein
MRLAARSHQPQHQHTAKQQKFMALFDHHSPHAWVLFYLCYPIAIGGIINFALRVVNNLSRNLRIRRLF